MTANTQDKTHIVYVGDPMCSWCYGFSTELNELVDHYGDNLQLDILVGGLRAGGGDEWNDEFKGFLKHHWEEVASRTGVEFSYDLFNRNQFTYDTEPACRSVVIVKKIAPEQVYIFFKAVQRKFYFENEDPSLLAFYQNICEELNISYVDFAKLWDDASIQEATLAEFQYAHKIGARGFPSLYLMENGQLIKIAAGYTSSDKLIQLIESRK